MEKVKILLAGLALFAVFGMSIASTDRCSFILTSIAP
jgi:hypothetical protein